MADYFWLITCSFLVFLMQAGFLCLESGRIRSKNSINVAAKNISDLIIAMIGFWAVGFSLMFGDSLLGVIGFSPSFLDVESSPWDISFFLFQVMFCGTATTLMSGAVAERMSFNGYLLCALVMSIAIYPVVGHWAWSGAFNSDNQGWLQALGFVDFAGSMVVHGVGGWLSLVAVLIIGPRIGRFEQGVQLPQGSNLPLSALGVLLIWFGWFGFNGGSTLVFDHNVPSVLLMTCLSAAWGGVLASSAYYLKYRFLDVTHLLNGVIAGLVGITAGCHAVGTVDAMIIGSVSGLLVFYATEQLEKWKIDDALGVVPAHLVPGIWGTMAVGLLGDLSILDTGLSRFEQVGVQLLGIVCISLWCIAVGYSVLFLLNKRIPLRVSVADEEKGMNVAEHNAATEMLDLLVSMKKQKDSADFSRQVPEHPFTEVGLVASQYNQVIKRVQAEISNRDNAINDFQESEKRKSAILDSSMDCIVTLDNKGHILEFNPTAERTFECPKSSVKGKSFIDYFVPVDKRNFAQQSLNHGFSSYDGLLINRRNELKLQRT
ncbi:ammonium transporter, partial [Vibrio sp. M260118]|uniref:ammonium transporter n=1 Tax=Vibrio sp. M260118 TaxID=3020896 RepID=UPI002F3EAE1A